jgi:hypothetical protein
MGVSKDGPVCYSVGTVIEKRRIKHKGTKDRKASNLLVILNSLCVLGVLVFRK